MCLCENGVAYKSGRCSAYRRKKTALYSLKISVEEIRESWWWGQRGMRKKSEWPPPSVQSLLRRRPHSSRLVGVNVIYIYIFILSHLFFFFFPFVFLALMNLAWPGLFTCAIFIHFPLLSFKLFPPKAALKKPSFLSCRNTRASDEEPPPGRR